MITFILALVSVVLAAVLLMCGYALNVIAKRVKSIEINHVEMQSQQQAEAAKVTTLLGATGLLDAPVPAKGAAIEFLGLENAFTGEAPASASAPVATPVQQMQAVTNADGSSRAEPNFDPLQRLLDLEAVTKGALAQASSDRQLLDQVCAVIQRHSESLAAANVGLNGIRADVKTQVVNVAKQLGKAVDTLAGEVKTVRDAAFPLPPVAEASNGAGAADGAAK